MFIDQNTQQLTDVYKQLDSSYIIKIIKDQIKERDIIIDSDDEETPTDSDDEETPTKQGQDKQTISNYNQPKYEAKDILESMSAVITDTASEERMKDILDVHIRRIAMLHMQNEELIQNEALSHNLLLTTVSNMVAQNDFDIKINKLEEGIEEHSVLNHIYYLGNSSNPIEVANTYKSLIMAAKNIEKAEISMKYGINKIICKDHCEYILETMSSVGLAADATLCLVEMYNNQKDEVYIQYVARYAFLVYESALYKLRAKMNNALKQATGQETCVYPDTPMHDYAAIKKRAQPLNLNYSTICGKTLNKVDEDEINSKKRENNKRRPRRTYKSTHNIHTIKTAHLKAAIVARSYISKYEMVMRCSNNDAIEQIDYILANCRNEDIISSVMHQFNTAELTLKKVSNNLVSCDLLIPIKSKKHGLPYTLNKYLLDTYHDIQKYFYSIAMPMPHLRKASINVPAPLAIMMHNKCTHQSQHITEMVDLLQTSILEKLMLRKRHRLVYKTPSNNIIEKMSINLTYIYSSYKLNLHITKKERRVLSKLIKNIKVRELIREAFTKMNDGQYQLMYLMNISQLKDAIILIHEKTQLLNTEMLG